MENTYHQLADLILTQGIVRSEALQPMADLRQDLAYRPSDIAELVILTERELHLAIPSEDYHRFTTLYEASKYIKEKLQESA